MSSPFLKVPETGWVASNTLAFALRDRYPVSLGHTLVIPRRPVATWFEATLEEQQALFQLVDTVKRGLDDGHPRRGETAGQPVFHLHVHVGSTSPDLASAGSPRTERDSRGTWSSRRPRSCPSARTSRA